MFEREAARYSIASELFLSSTNFTAAEARSIIALIGSLAGAVNRPLFGPARAAALKLETCLPATLRRELKLVARSIDVRFNPLDRLSGQQTVYDQLVQARAERRFTAIGYKSLLHRVVAQRAKHMH